MTNRPFRIAHPITRVFLIFLSSSRGVRRQSGTARVAHGQELPEDKADDPHAAERFGQDEEDLRHPSQCATAANLLNRKVYAATY